jgi:NitT/TauT family transport system substrate-binding protein
VKKFLVITISAVLLLSCQRKAGPEQTKTVRVAFFPNITHAQALYGKHTGAFQEALGSDISIQWIEFNAGPSEIEAMFAGEVDIGYIGPIPAINGNAASEGDLQIIAGASNAGAVFVTRSGLTLDSPVRLSGLKIAVPQLGNTQHISLLQILREHNLQTTDKGGTVTVVPSGNADTLLLLDRGEIDGALVPEPWGMRMEYEAGAELFLDERQVWREGDYPVALVIASTDFMQNNPGIVKSFLAAHKKITGIINENPAEARTAINGELLNLTGKALEEPVLVSAFDRVLVTSEISREAVIAFHRILADSGLARSPTIRSDIVNTELLDSLP